MLPETPPASSVPDVTVQRLLPAWEVVESSAGFLCVSYRAPRARSLFDGIYEKIPPPNSGALRGLLLFYK